MAVPNGGPRISVDTLGNVFASLVLVVMIWRIGMLMLLSRHRAQVVPYSRTSKVESIVDQVGVLQELLQQTTKYQDAKKVGWNAGIANEEEGRKMDLDEGMVRGQFGETGTLPSGRDMIGAESSDLPRRKALIFTMDSLQERIEAAKRGGPAGEIKIRRSLTEALETIGIEVDVAVSDKDFYKKGSSIDDYSIIIVDPWTWAGKGWRLKAPLQGEEGKMFVLDFFGGGTTKRSLRLPPERVLTAYPIYPSNTFLGYKVDPSQLPPPGVTKKAQGVIWGKSASNLKGKESILLGLAKIVELHSSVSPLEATITHRNIKYHGHLSSDSWHLLLAESKFMIGLGDPLAGPSAVDAVVAGCLYINPMFAEPQRKEYPSQHPYLAQVLDGSYVCSFREQDVEGAMACVRQALSQDLPPMIPPDFTAEAYIARVKKIFAETGR